MCLTVPVILSGMDDLTAAALKDLGDRVRVARIRARFRTQDAAAEPGMTRTIWQQLEGGKPAVLSMVQSTLMGVATKLGWPDMALWDEVQAIKEAMRLREELAQAAEHPDPKSRSRAQRANGP
jgi:hypothetical protein